MTKEEYERAVELAKELAGPGFVTAANMARAFDIHELAEMVARLNADRVLFSKALLQAHTAISRRQWPNHAGFGGHGRCVS